MVYNKPPVQPWVDLNSKTNKSGNIIQRLKRYKSITDEMADIFDQASHIDDAL